MWQLVFQSTVAAKRSIVILLLFIPNGRKNYFKSFRRISKYMILLGPGPQSAFPTPFCSCPACTKALLSTNRKLKRRRSSLLLNQKNLIDFGPDVMHACGEYSCSLAKLENVFITHSHEDHLDIWNIGFMQMAITKTNPISLYMSKAAYKSRDCP